jgi:sec-independent protein translocase protein TatC
MWFAKPIYAWLSKPLVAILPENSHLITTYPSEAWLTYFQVGLYTSLFLAAPFVYWTAWRFIAPGLYQSERKLFLFSTVFSTVFFMAGALFGYGVMFPFALGFLTDVIKDTPIVFLPGMSGYLDFAFKLIIAFGLTFEMPLIMVLLARLRVLTAAQMKSARRIMIVVIFFVSAVLTPPDIVSQCLMALPMLVLYELGLILAQWLAPAPG